LRGKLAAVAALEAALSAFEAGGDLEECLAIAASRPDGGPVAAAMAGQLAGACYGAAALPAGLRASLARVADLEAMADALVDRAPREPAP
jgi:ADP-ribosyl-[dinitrogen reductase] hydrolase